MATTTKSMQDYIRDDDFLGAVDRLNSTNNTWRKRWFEVCRTIYEKSMEWAKEYVLDPIECAVRRVKSLKTYVPKVRKADIQVADGCNLFNENRAQKCYLIEFFDENDHSICAKVGTTVRKVQQRIREELSSDTYKKMGAVRCVIHRVYDCGEIPAEGLESYFRAMYIRKYPQSFQKNDRFMKMTFDLSEADKIVAAYLA